MTVNEARVVATREGPHYPKTETHTWGAFAGLALEFDGYSNVEIVNPWNGQVLFVPDSVRLDDPHRMAATLRRVADALEATGFMNEEAGSDG